MIRRIVVPVDGTEASEKILSHLSELFRAADAEILFVHVSDRSEAGLRRGRIYLEGLAARAASRFPYLGTALLKGVPAFEILKAAVVGHADLIALMTRTRSAVKKLLFGSTALELMRSSQIPLYLARPEWAARPIRRILVPLDGSRTSLDVLPVAADLAQGAGASLSLLSAVPNEKLRDAADRALKRASSRLARQGIPVKTMLRSGGAAAEILGAARDEGVDVIALGTHGRRGSERFFFGSVAESVIDGAGVPMLLRGRRRSVTRPARESAPAAR